MAPFKMAGRSASRQVEVKINDKKSLIRDIKWSRSIRELKKLKLLWVRVQNNT